MLDGWAESCTETAGGACAGEGPDLDGGQRGPEAGNAARHPRASVPSCQVQCNLEKHAKPFLQLQPCKEQLIQGTLHFLSQPELSDTRATV